MISWAILRKYTIYKNSLLVSVMLAFLTIQNITCFMWLGCILSLSSTRVPKTLYRVFHVLGVIELLGTRWHLYNSVGDVESVIGLSIERPILDHHPKAHVHEIQQISWNPADFTMKSGRFHHEIHEIQQISPWNPLDFRWNRKDLCKEL